MTATTLPIYRYNGIFNFTGRGSVSYTRVPNFD